MQLHCKWCDTFKSEEEFLKRVAKEPYSQKNVRCCRECNKERNKKRYHENPEVRLKLRQACQKWGERNRDRQAEYHRKYERDNFVKRKAKDAVNAKVRSGRIIRQSCEVCGKEFGHAHHDSYEQDKWLDVRWLCAQHHKSWHMILDPLKLEGEGRKAIDTEFIKFCKQTGE